MLWMQTGRSLEGYPPRWPPSSGENISQYLPPNVDTGDFVIVVNASKVRLTGQKREDKVYYYHTGYPDGLKSIGMGKLLEKDPEKLFMRSIGGMLPKNTLGREMLKKLKVYSGPEHPHEAQEPKPLTTDGGN